MKLADDLSKEESSMQPGQDATELFTADATKNMHKTIITSNLYDRLKTTSVKLGPHVIRMNKSFQNTY